MSFGQKIIYLRRLLGYYLLYDNYEKRKIDIQVRTNLKSIKFIKWTAKLGKRFQKFSYRSGPSTS